MTVSNPVSLAEQKIWIRRREAGSSAQSGSSANDKSARCIARCGWLEGMKCTAKVTTGTAFQLRIKGTSLIKVEQRTEIWMSYKFDIDRKTFILIVEDFHALRLGWNVIGHSFTVVSAGMLVSVKEFSYVHLRRRSVNVCIPIHSEKSCRSTSLLGNMSLLGRNMFSTE